MHLLRAQPGDIDDGAEAVDLGQDPAEIVFAGHADTELALLARCHARIEDPPGLRLANLARLTHHLSVDTYVARTVAGAGLVVLRLLGGVASWAYGVERVVLTCRRHGIPLVLLTGSDEDDPALAERSTVGDERRAALWAYLAQGGAENGRRFLLAARALLRDDAWPEPAEPVARAGLYRRAEPGGGPLLVVVFYRALLMAEDLAPVDALIREAAACGLRVTAVFVQSLKDPVARAFLDDLLTEEPPDVVVNLTGFAVSQPGAVHEPGPLDRIGAVVLQAVAAGTTRERWRASAQGLSARDLAMSVVLPEVDGRVFTRAIAFKSARARIEATQSDLVALEPLSDRVRFVVAQAAAWARLRRSPAGARRVALLLANYPNQDARLANGVGLDTPESAAVVMRALEEAGYVVSGCPESGRALMDMLRAGPTNARRRTSDVRLDRAAYARFSDALPEELRSAVVARWGAVEKDPAFRDGAFHLALHRMGNVVVGIQPARGYEVDPKATYHDPALVPPHGYIAFYAWLRTQFDAHAIVHLGKHGNLEWLPGKALGLSAACWPEAVLGPLPHLYPFIVNDPGEGSQAKRRTSAVVVDHLTPPLTRAESYGPLRDLEALVDEYYDAAGQDPRRLDLLRGQIHEMMALHSLDEDAGIEEGEEEDAALVKLDAWLCDLKERQIRDGLHVFGRSPEGRQETDLLVAVARGQRPSLIRTLADDLALGGFDPLACDMAQPWTGPRPEVLAALSDDLWRSVGDTVERLELLAVAVVEGRVLPPGPASAARLAAMEETLCRSLRACGPAEIESLLTGLDGRFVAPGPSGAPTRDRADVLPTGRNFYAVDTRSVPTPAAWTLGWRSAVRLLDRYRQEHGSWPERIGLSAWGTANMRTGGDDIAQALALMGVRPTWETASRRVAGFEIMPLSVLGRPRIDVTLRVSGFFRDAFPVQMDLIDSAARAVMALDEPARSNPLAARFKEERARLEAEGMDAARAAERAGHRVFGSMPGAYGAGLQALIDGRAWSDKADLADAYLSWGGFAYGGGREGVPARASLEVLLGRLDAVIQNQDNHEHDILDSDDYYQFQGGMTAAAEALSGSRPAVFLGDHSRIENPRIRTLEEEIARVVRARAANPKWIAGVMRHGYKGAFEMAATVDYLFAYAATTGAVRDHHFALLFEAYLEEPRVRAFVEDVNPDALRAMADRFAEAIERGLWRPRRNHVARVLDELTTEKESA